MSPRTFSWSFAVAAALTVVAAAPAAKADFTLVSQNLTINRHDNIADFSLTFNQAPDFGNLDSLGRPNNSFQYNFDGDFQPESTNPTHDWTAIIRGDEIHFGDGIRIRQADGDGGSNSGGWGPVITSVPMHLIGNNVSFSVPTADLGYTGGSYRYDVFSLHHGSQTGDQNVTVVPLPSAFYSGLLGLTLVAGAGAYIRRSNRLAIG